MVSEKEKCVAEITHYALGITHLPLRIRLKPPTSYLLPPTSKRGWCRDPQDAGLGFGAVLEVVGLAGVDAEAGAGL